MLDDIYSAAEYSAWSGVGSSRGRGLRDAPKGPRSSSLPPRGILSELAAGVPGQRFSIPPAAAYPYGPSASTPNSGLYASVSYPSQTPAVVPADRSIYTRLDVSPLLHRRGAPGPQLRPVGSGWNADEAPHLSQPSTSTAPPAPTFPLGPTLHSTAAPPSWDCLLAGVEELRQPVLLSDGDVMPYHTGLLTAMTGLLIVHILEGWLSLKSVQD